MSYQKLKKRKNIFEKKSKKGLTRGEKYGIIFEQNKAELSALTYTPVVLWVNILLIYSTPIE